MHQDDVELLAALPAGFDGRRHARDVAVVVRAPDIDHALEPAQVLFAVVGDVRGEIGGLPVAAHHHAVLFVPEGRAFEPPGPLRRVDDAARLEVLEGLVDLA